MSALEYAKARLWQLAGWIHARWLGLCEAARWWRGGKRVGLFTATDADEYVHVLRGDELPYEYGTRAEHGRRLELAGLDLPGIGDTDALEAVALRSRLRSPYVPVVATSVRFVRTETDPFAADWSLPIFAELATEWPGLLAARERALRTPTQEVRVVFDAIVSAWDWTCEHCGDGDHRECVGCECECTLVGQAS